MKPLMFSQNRFEGEEKAQELIHMFLQEMGQDVNREGLQDTPKRVVKAFIEMTCGTDEDPKKHLQVTFPASYDEIVALKNIEFTSLCEHHLLPFVGTASIAYIPSTGGVVGISKLARVVSTLSRRLQIQEQMTDQIADVIEECLNPKGVAVIVEAHHHCMGCRGVHQKNTQMITSSMRGVFRTEHAARAEVLSLLR